VSRGWAAALFIDTNQGFVPVRAHDQAMPQHTTTLQRHHSHVHLERLENMLTDLMRLISEQRGGQRSRAEVASESLPGPGDSHAQSITQRDLDFGLGERETARLHEVEAALKRLHDGTYGICTTCGQEIMEARLDAMPETAHCMACQVQLEPH
jgi:DnaK suppressor protein